MGGAAGDFAGPSFSALTTRRAGGNLWSPREVNVNKSTNKDNFNGMMIPSPGNTESLLTVPDSLLTAAGLHQGSRRSPTDWAHPARVSGVCRHLSPHTHLPWLCEGPQPQAPSASRESVDKNTRRSRDRPMLVLQREGDRVWEPAPGQLDATSRARG